MQHIVKFGLTKASISSTLYTAVKYEPRSLGGIGPFDLFVIQGTVRIYFLIKQYWKSTPSIPILWANLYTLKMEAEIGGHILEKNYIETKQWLQAESWILEVYKLMSVNQINISHLV